MLSTVVKYAVGGVLLLLLYRLVRGYVAPSPLENIPGPAPKSSVAGTMADLADRNAWPLLDRLTNEFGQVVKCAGPLGVNIPMRDNLDADAGDRLPAEEIVAHITTFVSAGMDTTSNALARILHLLCVHADVQNKLREELLEARAQNGAQDLDYDTLVLLPYLDAVCRETLRLYPPASFVIRGTTKDATLPLSAPLKLRDGTTTSARHVPQDTTLLVGIYSSNRNPALWGVDAREWRPGRWLAGALPAAVTDATIPGVYSNLMTFNGGGRACIGFKFSQLEMKVVLATLVCSLRLALAQGKNADVVWDNTGIAYPTVGGAEKPSLPLRVARVAV